MAEISSLSIPIGTGLTRAQWEAHREYVRRAQAYYRKRFCPRPYQYPFRLPNNIHVEYRDGNVVVEIIDPKGGLSYVR